MNEPVIVDQSGWGLLLVTGADRVRFLQGMLSNDVATLAEGQWCRATTLNVKGRVLAVADAVREGESFLLITEPVTADKLQALLSKHAIADDVEFTRVSRVVHRVWDSPEAVWTAPPVFAAREASPEGDVEVRRVEGGLARYGVDVSEDYFPFEAHLEAALSFGKGCYIGQEVVVRATTRGAAKKKLVGLRFAGEGPVAVGTALAGPDKPDAGIVTSSVVSPRFGAIGLAYLHHTLVEPGTTVAVGERTATVSALPFA
jgi:tRNA-modifying protein YgfZ